jgi:hypothetical protein
MTDRPETLVLSVALESGAFESNLRIPFPCSIDVGRDAIEKWLDFAMTGLRIGASDMNAALAEART